MSRDWIKMRGSLYDHPKVLAIARRLVANAEFRAWMGIGDGAISGHIAGHETVTRKSRDARDNFVTAVTPALRVLTLGALLRAWSSARENGCFEGENLVLRYSTLADLDSLACPGLGEAMVAVGWARVKNGVILPNFREFNVPATPAERQRAARERRHENVTQKSRDSHAGRVTNALPEKRRVDTLPPNPPRGGASGKAPAAGGRNKRAAEPAPEPVGAAEALAADRADTVAAVAYLQTADPEAVAQAEADTLADASRYLREYWSRRQDSFRRAVAERMGWKPGKEAP